MSGNRRWQAELRAEKIDRSSLAIILAKNRGPFFILGPQVMIDMRYRADHFFPPKLICENLRERFRMRSLSSRRFHVDGPHIRDEPLGRQDWQHQRRT